jgi:hypothetical protein
MESYGEGIFKVKATACDTYLGGEDFDSCLVIIQVCATRGLNRAHPYHDMGKRRQFN